MDATGPKKSSNVAVFLTILAVIIVALFAMGIIPRMMGQQELKKSYEATVGAIPEVQTIIAKPASHQESIVLPGNIGAILYTTIYARVDGYLKERLVDIGDHVKRGQLLAVIDTPTIDQQLAQARADLKKAQAQELSSEAALKQSMAQELEAKAEIDKAKADVAYATITTQRWTNLCERGAVSQQSRDEKARYLGTSSAQLQANKEADEAAKAAVKAAQANVKAAKAQVIAMQADVKRLEAQVGFQKVLAPFEGVITLRKVDPGALITQGSGSSNLELYQMAKLDKLRIYVSVPQRVSRYLKNGMKTKILVSEYPERQFDGVVTNVSGALDPNTRTRQTEIHMDNPDHALLPGMYADVQIVGLREAPWIRVAGTCLVARTDGQYVVTVVNGKAHFQPITIGRDFGSEVEIVTGLKGEEQVIVSPNDDLREGDPVKAIAALSAT